MAEKLPIPEKMTLERLEDLETISKSCSHHDATHRHWFPNVYAWELLKEIRRSLTDAS